MDNQEENKQEIQEEVQQEVQQEKGVEKKSNNKKVVIIVVLILIVVIALISATLFATGTINLKGNREENNPEADIEETNTDDDDDEVAEEEEDSNQEEGQNNNQEENQTSNQEESQESETNIEDNNSTTRKIFSLTKKLLDGMYKLGDKEVYLKMEYDSFETRPNIIIKMDGKEIFRERFATEDHWIGNIYIMEDIILIVTSQTITSGQIYIYNNNGNLIKTIKQIEGNLLLSKDEYIDKSIIIYRRALSLLDDYTLNNGIALIDEEKCESLLEKNNVQKDMILFAKYEINYLGNNKFSDTKTLYEETAEEYVNTLIDSCKKEKE